MKRILSFALIVLAAVQMHDLNAQEIEVEFGVGYAGLNMEAWTGLREDGSYMWLEDWENVTGYAGAQILFPLTDFFSVGLGLGFQHLFWYERGAYVDPYSFYEEKNVSATRALGILRYKTGNYFLDMSLGVMSFDGYSDFVSMVGFGRSNRISENLSLPVKLNCGLVHDSDASILLITISAGLTYKLK